MNLGMPYQNLIIMDACLECNCHYLDTAAYEPENVDIKKSVDLRQSFTLVKDQGKVGSCTTFSITAIYEYLLKKTEKKYIIIDDNTRNCEDYDLNAELIADTFECVFSTTGDDGIENIYDTRLIVSH